MPFDTSVADANAAALKAAQAADAAAARNAWIRNGALGGARAAAGRPGLAPLAQARQGPRRTRRRTSWSSCARSRPSAPRCRPQRDEAATALALAPVADAAPDEMHDELVALVERQPDEVASLLRGWLVERP